MTATTLIVCAYRGLSVPTHHAIVQLMRAHPDWDELVVEQAPINRARSFAASQWYRDRPDEDVFLMVDDDILFEVDAAVRLVELCRDRHDRHDIIGAAYPFRDGSGIAMRPLPGDTSIRFGTGEWPREVMHIGTGFFAVHRRVLDALIPTLPLCSDRQMASAFWPLFQDEIVPDDAAAGGHNWLTEDYFLCDRARKLGFGVWLDPSIFLAHYGQVPVTLTNRDLIHDAITGTFAQPSAPPAAEPHAFVPQPRDKRYCNVCDKSPYSHPDPVASQPAWSISNQQAADLRARLDAARDALAAEWRARNPQTPEEIAEFYRTSEHMGADLEVWHETPARQQWTALVVSVAKQIGAKVAIDIGCGAGHELRALRAAGVPVVRGVEPNDRLREKLLDEFEVRASWVELAMEEPDTWDAADLLICLDVLEHVPDPETFLGYIADSAKKGAVLLESTGTADEGTPLHLESNLGWSPWPVLARYGWELLSAANRVHVWQRRQV